MTASVPCCTGDADATQTGFSIPAHYGSPMLEDKKPAYDALAAEVGCVQPHR
ncbi:MAG TPA: hypothetical protein VGK81_00755 [Anaerolineae bacterium]